jgi:hypothetical protein
LNEQEEENLTLWKEGEFIMCKKLLYLMSLILVLSLAADTATATDYYVATDGDDNDNGSIGSPFADGDDNDNGSIGSPFATVQKGFNTIDAGDTLYLRGGTYAEHILIPDYKQGDPNNWYTVKSYPGEWAIIDPNYDSATPVIRALGGYGQCPQYWLFESFEVTGGGMENQDSGSGIRLWTGTNIIFRYLYIHDNYGSTSNNNGGIVIQNDSGTAHDVKIEWCHLKDNACTNGENCANIILFSDYVEDPCNVDIDKALRKNEISYNLIEGSAVGIKYKNGQFLSLDHSGTHTTYNDYGDKVHHNIIRNQAHHAMIARQDFIQIYNNIFELDTIPTGNASGVSIEQGYSGDREKFYVCFYNNTLIRTRLAFERDFDTDGSSYDLDDYDDYHPHFYCYNNIIEDVNVAYDNHNDLNILFTYSSRWLESDIDMNTVNVEDNYFWPRTRTEDIINLVAPLNDYTANEYESAGYSTTVYASETSGLHKTGSNYKTDGSHVMEGTTTIADGGIGGSHPYLSGVTFPSYVGATDPNDDDWIDDVLDLVNLSSGAPGKATSPSPANSATGVSITADLSWTAGSGSTSSDVYFGTDSTPDSGEFQGNQTATTYDPGTMSNSTTYYWRIDEINGEGTTTGDVWNFTTVSAGARVSITADLSWTAGSGATSRDVYFGTTSPGASQGNQTATTFDTGTMSNNTTYYWRIDEVNASGTTTGTVWSFTTIAGAPGAASSPSPANSATDVNVTTDLSWTAGSGATSRDVYFGTSSPGTSQGNQTATTFDTGTMDPNTTYYWRIDEINAAATTTGTVWNFTTETESTATVGNTTVFGSTTTTELRRAMPFTMSEDGTIQSVAMYHVGGSDDMILGVYTGATEPNDRIAVTATTPVSGMTGWQTINLNSPVFVQSGTKIWLAWVYETNPGIAYEVGTPGRASSTDAWSAGMPDPFGSSTQDDYIYSIYANYTTSVTEEFGDAAGTDYPGTIEDTWNDVGNDGDDNYSSSTTLNTYTWPADTIANTTIIKWDLTDIPTDANVTEATLYLYQVDSDVDSSYDISVHKITGVDPNITTCTWNTYDGTNSWTGGADGGQSDIASAEDTQSVNLTDDEYKTWDVTDMVADWVNTPSSNYGMLVNSDDVASTESYRTFASTEDSNTAIRPKLIVTYTGGGATAPGQATNPSPANSATGVSITADLSWTEGSGSTSSDVYFGASSPGSFQGNQTAATFDPGTLSYDITYYWRIDEVNAEGTTTGTVWSFTTIVAAPGAASNPSPADSAADIAVDTDLSWSAGSGATSHDVYFGASSPGTSQGNQTATTFDTGTMSNNTTYYWRIDEVNAGGTTTGTVWSFTTIVAAPAAASSPSPANSATGVSITADLSWSAKLVSRFRCDKSRCLFRHQQSRNIPG